MAAKHVVESYDAEDRLTDTRQATSTKIIQPRRYGSAEIIVLAAGTIAVVLRDGDGRELSRNVVAVDLLRSPER